jgi:UDP-glucose 6-dehydrogenase
MGTVYWRSPRRRDGQAGNGLERRVTRTAWRLRGPGGGGTCLPDERRALLSDARRPPSETSVAKMAVNGLETL